MESPPFLEGGLGTVWNTLFWIVRAVAIIACAYFVYHSAVRRRHAALNIGPYWWLLFTLVGGIWTLLIYWLMEHSSLAAGPDADDP